MTNDNAFKDYKEGILKSVWGKYLKICTDYEYSSLLAQKKSKINKSCFIRILGLIQALYASFILLSNQGIISCTRAVLWVSLIYILANLIINIWKPSIVSYIIGISEDESKRLLNLNEELDVYQIKIFRFYFSMQACKDRNQFDNEYERYESMAKDLARRENEHDQLTGEIDKELEAKAQEIAKKKIEQRL
jgi:hypothetical protein